MLIWILQAKKPVFLFVIYVSVNKSRENGKIAPKNHINYFEPARISRRE